MKSERKPTQNQIIINRFIIPEFKVGKYFWPKESAAAKKLIQKYSFEFLNWVEPPFGYKVKSLLYFLSRDGEDYLGGQYFEYLKTQIKETKERPKPLDNLPILGDNVEIIKKPNSLQEFLKI